MSRKRIAVLYEVWWPDELPPPPALLGETPPPSTDDDGEPDVMTEIYDALKALGHLPSYVVLDGEARSLSKLARTPASLFFNLTESYAGDDTKDMHVAAYLELLGKPYTGNDPRALHIGQDKALAKKLLRFHGVPTPDFAMVERGGKPPRKLRLPLIVKPPREDGSIGIDAGSVVSDVKSLRRRIRYVHETFECGALVERYVGGREFYVSIVGNDPPEALPLVEIDLSKLPEHVPRIAGTEVKWWKGTSVYRVTKSIFPTDLGKELTRKIQRTAVAAYQALGMRDYGRVDLRVTPKGDVFVIEVNPNPWLSSQCEFTMAWEKRGGSYVELVERLIGLALERTH